MVTKSLEHIAATTFNKLHVLVDLYALFRTLVTPCYLDRTERQG